MFAVCWAGRVQAIFVDRASADDWKHNQVSAYPADSEFNVERAEWSVRPVTVNIEG